MDAVMRAQHPGRDLDSLSELMGLAGEVGAEVELGTDGEIQPLDPCQDPQPTQQHPSPIQESFNPYHIPLPVKGTLPHELRPFLSSHAIPLTSDEMSGIFKIPEGSLVPAPKGGYHYVGPASVATFAKSARELVSKSNASTIPTFDEVGLKRFLKAAEFTTFRNSQAIEARIEGHPATAAAEEAGEPSPARPYDNTFGGFGSIPSHPSPALSPRNTMTFRRMVEILPDRSLSDRLVASFFNRVHPNFTVYHRGTFQMRYETIWATGPRQTNTEPEPGWTCGLYMIYVLGAQAMEEELGSESESLQQRFASAFIRDGLPRLALTASLANVQALMLLSLYQHNVGERNAAWMLLGQASRTAVALGMHRDGQNGNFDPFERNTRRVVWWVLHMFEQNLSFTLGRPGGTDLIDTSAILPEEVYLDGNELPPGYFERAVALTEICSRIRRFTASVASYYQDQSHMATTTQTAIHMLAQLTAWKADLPVHLSYNYHFATPRHRRAVLLLHIQCDHLQSIVGRSYLLCRVNDQLDCFARGNSSTLDQGIKDLANVSVTSANGVVDGLMALSSHNLLESLVWLDFYYVHHAAFVIALHFLGKPLDNSSEDSQQRTAISTLLGIAKQAKLAPTYRILTNVALQLAYIVGVGPEDEVIGDPREVEGLNLLASLPLQSMPSNPQQQSMFPPPFQQQSQNPYTSQPQSYNTLEQLFGPMPPSQHNSPPDMFADLYNFGLDTSAENPWDFFNIGVTAEGLMQGLRGLEDGQNGNNGQ